MRTTLQTPGTLGVSAGLFWVSQHCWKQPVPSIQPALVPSAPFTASSASAGKEHPHPSGWVSRLLQGLGRLWG